MPNDSASTVAVRRLIAAGVRRGSGPLVVEQPRLTEALPPAALHAMTRIERALAAPERELAAKVGKALGFHSGWQPRDYLGETATHITTWTQRELNDVFERVGGTVTTRPVERSTSNGDVTWAATEIILTVDLPGIGRVTVVTDWDEETGGHDLPVMRAIGSTTDTTRRVAPVMPQADRERHAARCYGLWAAATNFRRHAKAE